MKLGSIPLKEANDDQASLIAALVKDPELLAKLLSKLTVTFQQVKASTGGYKLD